MCWRDTAGRASNFIFWREGGGSGLARPSSGACPSHDPSGAWHLCLVITFLQSSQQRNHSSHTVCLQHLWCKLLLLSRFSHVQPCKGHILSCLSCEPTHSLCVQSEGCGVHPELLHLLQVRALLDSYCRPTWPVPHHLLLHLPSSQNLPTCLGLAELLDSVIWWLNHTFSSKVYAPSCSSFLGMLFFNPTVSCRLPLDLTLIPSLWLVFLIFFLNFILEITQSVCFFKTFLKEQVTKAWKMLFLSLF